MNKTPHGWPLAATSWLWPKTLPENLRRIGAWKLPIRQVALLFYQSAASLAYTPADFAAPDHLESHVHLPVDLPWESGPEAVWDVITRLMELAAPLSPWAGVLHPPAEPSRLAGVAALWRSRSPGWRLLVENIPGQDLKAHWPVIREMDLPVCLDVGHLMAFGQHWLLEEPDLPGRVELLHCYAPGIVRERHEHLPLSELSPSQARTILAVLGLIGANTPILFEVFSESHLRDCLENFTKLTRDWRRPE
jgi:hypothetical protein